MQYFLNIAWEDNPPFAQLHLAGLVFAPYSGPYSKFRIRKELGVKKNFKMNRP
jgi:hypothetical protein